MTLLSFLGLQLAMVAVLMGLGFLVLPARGRDSFLLFAPWVGMSLVLAGLPLLHLGMPMGAKVAGVLFVLAIAGWARAGKDVFRHRRDVGIAAGVFLGACVILAWPLAMTPLLHYDWGLYYQQVQKWSVACPVVPGIGQLHSRFAFPGTSFLAAGLLDSLMGEHWWGSRLLGAQFLSLGVTTLIVSLWGSIRNGDRFLQGMLLVIPLFVSLLLEWDLIGVAAPDLLSAILIVLWGVIAFRFLEGDHRLSALLLPLATALVVLKLSNLVFVACVVALLFWRCKWRPGWRETALWSTLVVGWMGHNWVQSGWPLYPFGMALGSPDWAMEPGRVELVGDAIRGWARLPGPHYLESLRGRPWLGEWLRWELSSSTLHVLGGAVALALLALGIRRARGLSISLPASVPWFLGGCLASLLAWFLSAPDERFALGLLWMTGAIASGCLFHLIDVRWLRNALAVLVMLALLPHVVRIGTQPVMPLQPRQELQRVVLPSGLAVWMPAGVGQDQVWNAPLPATPERFDIEMRGNSLCDGFRMRKAR